MTDKFRVAAMALFCCAAWVAVGGQAPEGPDKDSLTVMGILVDAKGAPVSGKRACIFLNQEGKQFAPLRLTKEGRIEETSAVSDAKGRFRIVANRNKEFGLGLCESEVLKGGELKMKTLVEKVSAGEKVTVNLGKVVVR
jgi:hypothetical protein